MLTTGPYPVHSLVPWMSPVLLATSRCLGLAAALVNEQTMQSREGVLGVLAGISGVLLRIVPEVPSPARLVPPRRVANRALLGGNALRVWSRLSGRNVTQQASNL